MTLDPTVPKGAIAGAQISIPCPSLAPMLDFLTDLGFRLHTIFPADEPQVASMSGFGLRVKLQQLGEMQPLPTALELELLIDQADFPAGAPRTRTAPNGMTVRFVDAEPTFESKPKIELGTAIVSALSDGSGEEGGWVIGRAGMQYKDLIPGRLDGACIASLIRIPGGGPVPDYAHFHNIRFQIIWVKRGWVKVVYEDQGEPFVMEAGDGVIQPPAIRHRVLESSPGLEVVEISGPAVHATHADHDISLPTGKVLPDRGYGMGHRFSRFRNPSNVDNSKGWPAAPGEVVRIASEFDRASEGTIGLQVVRVKPGADDAALELSHQGEMLFGFVAGGSAVLKEASQGGKGVHRLGVNDSFAIPPGQTWTLSAAGDETLELLEVRIESAGNCSVDFAPLLLRPLIRAFIAPAITSIVVKQWPLFAVVGMMATAEATPPALPDQHPSSPAEEHDNLNSTSAPPSTTGSPSTRDDAMAEEHEECDVILKMLVNMATWRVESNERQNRDDINNAGDTQESVFNTPLPTLAISARPTSSQSHATGLSTSSSTVVGNADDAHQQSTAKPSLAGTTTMDTLESSSGAEQLLLLSRYAQEVFVSPQYDADDGSDSQHSPSSTLRLSTSPSLSAIDAFPPSVLQPAAELQAPPSALDVNVNQPEVTTSKKSAVKRPFASIRRKRVSTRRNAAMSTRSPDPTKTEDEDSMVLSSPSQSFSSPPPNMAPSSTSSSWHPHTNRVELSGLNALARVAEEILNGGDVATLDEFDRSSSFSTASSAATVEVVMDHIGHREDSAAMDMSSPNMKPVYWQSNGEPVSPTMPMVGPASAFGKLESSGDSATSVAGLWTPVPTQASSPTRGAIPSPLVDAHGRPIAYGPDGLLHFGSGATRVLLAGTSYATQPAVLPSPSLGSSGPVLMAESPRPGPGRPSTKNGATQKKRGPGKPRKSKTEGGLEAADLGTSSTTLDGAAEGAADGEGVGGVAASTSAAGAVTTGKRVRKRKSPPSIASIAGPSDTMMDEATEGVEKVSLAASSQSSFATLDGRPTSVGPDAGAEGGEGEAAVGTTTGAAAEKPKKSTAVKARPNFPPDVLKLLTGWLNANLGHPYPPQDVKQQLAKQTGLKLKQVNDWFINARRRRLS
ncbi:hypothetical protein HDU96_007542 [Phlyctochytrium bullatum]|nr:hypothetical protein HDU96_007542 [Phlyctochytrium bullatum]